MKKNFFTKSMATLLALIMVMGMFAVMPISAAGMDDELPQASLIPYHLADSGDLLYQIDFRGDSAFANPDYLAGANGEWLFGTETKFIANTEGNELLVEGSGRQKSENHYWGCAIEGLTIPSDGMLSMLYKAKPLDRNDKTAGTNNSAAIGIVAADPAAAIIYKSYGNHGSEKATATETRDGRPTTDSLHRLEIGGDSVVTNPSKASGTNGVELSAGYTYFDDLPNQPLKDADGYMTVLMEYDAKNSKLNLYYLYTGTGALKTDWQMVQTANYQWKETDVVGCWVNHSYRITRTSFKDVGIYKGTYYQNSPLVEVGTAAQLAALNTTLADASLASSNTVRVQLTNNIDMSGVAYTPVSTDKKIQFNGNGYTISNLSVGTAQAPVEKAALFATAGAGSTFRNFTMEEVAIYGKLYTAAVLANPAYGDLAFSNISISGNIVDATPDADLSGHVGFAGALVGSNTKLDTVNTEVAWTIGYVTNNASVTGTVSAAGLVGAACGAINFDVSYCANTGAITALGKGSKNADNQAAGLVNLRHHGYSTGNVMTDGSFRNCYNTGKLTLAALNSKTEMAGTAGIVGVYRVLGNYQQDPAPAYANTLAFYNCFDLSQRQYPAEGGASPAEHAAISLWTSKNEITSLTYTNCYGAVAEGSANTYTALFAGDDDIVATKTDSDVVTSANAKITLDSGSSSINDMIARLSTAIENLAEVEMPMGGFDDGMNRDYTWYYKDGALVQKGTESSPYTINTKAQFAALSALTWGWQDPDLVGGSMEPVDFEGKYFKLMTNVDLTGYQVAPLNMNGATIYFDGNNKTISNWTITNVSEGGMFSNLGRGSVVKDFVLDNVNINAIGTSAMVVATAKAGLTVSNVKVKDTCSLTTSSRIGGGIVGSIVDEDAAAGTRDNAGDVVQIQFCVNEADISAREILGGIFAYRKGVFDYQISCCVNKGDLTATRTTGGVFYVGGILGHTERGKQTVGTYLSFIVSCYNVGNITTADTTSYCYAGGIAGYLKSQNESEITIMDCYDYSSRKLSTTSTDSDKLFKNAGLVAHADKGQLIKYVEYCAAANAPGSEAMFIELTLWDTYNTSMIDDETVVLVTGLDGEVISPVTGQASTMKAEMDRIDGAIASMTPQVNNPGSGCEHAYDNNCDADCNLCGEKRNVPDHVYDNDQDATCNVCGATRTVETAPTQSNTPAETTAPAEEKKGCGSALNSTYAVIALVAVLGFAFVAKKREEN